MAYQRWNGASYDLLVYDVNLPAEPPTLVHSGDFSRIISWAPDSQWLLSVSQASVDYTTNFYSLIVFHVEARATPHVVLPRTEVNWSVWGANGKIYWWDWTALERRSIDPSAEWRRVNPGPFSDRTMITYLFDRREEGALRFACRWFHTSPEEEGLFVYMNPGQLSPTTKAYDVFPDGLRFIVSVPTFCGVGAVVDREGRIITPLWSTGCDEPNFGPRAVTSDGQFVVGTSSERDQLPNALYLADASAAWRVPIENAPRGWFTACSRTGFSLAYENFPQDSIYVGDLVITQVGSSTSGNPQHLE